MLKSCLSGFIKGGKFEQESASGRYNGGECVLGKLERGDAAITVVNGVGLQSDENDLHFPPSLRCTDVERETPVHTPVHQIPRSGPVTIFTHPPRGVSCAIFIGWTYAWPAYARVLSWAAMHFHLKTG